MAALTGSTQAADELLIDDFTDRDGLSSFGTRWNGFTDRVMGGRSDMQAGVVETDDGVRRNRRCSGPALRMRGSVRLDNNGGFIQVRLPLETGGETLDAADFAAWRWKSAARPARISFTENTRLSPALAVLPRRVR